MQVVGRSRSIAFVALAVLSLGGCASSIRDQKDMVERAYVEQHSPVRPQQSRTDFSDALQCMDQMMLDHGRRNIFVAIKHIPDPSGKAAVATKEMIQTALSKMSRLSGAFRVIDYELDLAKSDTVQNLSQLLMVNNRMDVSAPTLYVSGAIAYLDQNVTQRRQGIGFSHPKWDIGVDRDIIGSMVALDLHLGDFKTRSLIPGVESANMLAIAKSGSAVDGGGLIKAKYGIQFYMNVDVTNSTGAAVRSLVELGLVEIIGKWTRLPYWNCLGAEANHPEIQRELFDWYRTMSVADRIRIIQRALQREGYWTANADGKLSQRLRSAVLRYQADQRMLATGGIDFALYERLLRGRIEIDEQKKFQRAEWMKKHDDEKVNAKHDTPPGNVPLAIQLASNVPADGQVPRNTKLVFTAATSRLAYLYCFYKDRTGALTQVYPNPFNTEQPVLARRAQQVPGEGDPFSFSLTKPGSESVTCFADEQDMGRDLPQKFGAGPLKQLASRNLDAIRAYMKMEGSRAFAEQSIQYVVQ